eukprot:TRINITY_DN28226_c0_g1_i1.p1 TRINITY_DN28226_c0_g1~~TRINITY_DN28226_c0_g1_i1.p1  ORF type:complete len:293 (-),score=20.31 TRINITY_DN28226_c0_g1_i1:41-919(-)
MSCAILLFCFIGVVFNYESYATHFDGIGTPYGGCGLPSYALETQDYVALNVQNTPHDYSTYLPRPIMDPSKVGMFTNGRNCGRWVRVTIGDYCLGGANSGQPGSGFCPGGKWISDNFNGATLDLIVTDSCQDGNEWCRDDTFHLDIHTESLPRFQKNGVPIGNGIFNSWNNRKITWDFIKAPSYSGNIVIGFRQGAEPQYYPAIAIAHLPNGISGVQRLVGGNWQNATMISDNGQAFILPNGLPPYTIRYVDQSFVISGGYTFGFPAECGSKCSNPFTKVAYSMETINEEDY